LAHHWGGSDQPAGAQAAHAGLVPAGTDTRSGGRICRS